MRWDFVVWLCNNKPQGTAYRIKTVSCFLYAVNVFIQWYDIINGPVLYNYPIAVTTQKIARKKTDLVTRD